MSNIKVNFTDKEATSEAGNFEVLPTGNYDVAITNIEAREVKEGKNQGKPWWNVEMTVQSGKFENKKCWGSVMLFDGALYSAAQLLKATGFGNALETGVIPSASELEGKKLTVVIQKKVDDFKSPKGAKGDDIIWKAEVRGYKAAGNASSSGIATSSAGKAGGAQDLLP